MRETIKNVKYLLKLYLKYGYLPFVLAILQGIISGTIITYISVNLSKIAIDGIISNAPFMSVLSLIIILFAIQLIFALLTQIVNTYVNQPFGIRLSAGIKQEVFYKVLNTDFAHFDKPKFYDDYTWTSKRLATQATQAASIVTSLISSLAKIIMLVVMISIIDPILVVFSVLSILVNGVLYKQVAKINFNHDSEYLPIEKRWNYLGRVFYLKEYFYELKTTKLSQFLFRRAKSNLEQSIGLHKKYRPQLCALEVIQSISSTLFYVFAFVYLLYKASNGFITIGEFSAMLAAFGMLRSGIGNFVDGGLQLKKMNLYTQKAIGFMTTESQIEEKCSKITLLDEPYHIRFENVSFKYGNNSSYVFEKINFEFKPKQKIAIVGQNGAGKTTLVKLLLRLYDTTEGCIYINNIPIRDLDLKILRENVGVAFQQSHVYSESIRNNISLYSDTPVDDKCITDALSKVSLNSLATDETGFETELTREFSTNGIELSGGQTQLLALSRLFIKKFNLVILDEPSSALDPLTEYALNKIFMEEFQDSTVVIIAHRLSTVRDADYTYLLHDGYIAEEGTHEDLMNKRGLYWEMFTKQAEKYVK